MQFHKTVYVGSQSVDPIIDRRESIVHFLSEGTNLKTDAGKPAIYLRKACVDLFESSVYLPESRIYLLESCIYLPESCIYLPESRVHLPKASPNHPFQ
jgi:hypothetical protein